MTKKTENIDEDKKPKKTAKKKTSTKKKKSTSKTATKKKTAVKKVKEENLQNLQKTTTKRKPYKRPKDETIIDALYDCLAVIADAAEKLNCHRSTLNDWINESTVLTAAFIDAREAACDTAESSLLKRIRGYDHVETKVFNNQGVIITKDINKHYPPDPHSADIFLRAYGKKRGFAKEDEKSKVKEKTYEEKLKEMNARTAQIPVREDDN